MDPPESLTVRLTTASSPISGYRLIDMSILTDEFLLLSCPGCHGIQCLKLCDNNEKKRKVWQDIYNSVALFAYIATYFSPRKRLIYRRKTNDDKNVMMRILELFVMRCAIW